MTSHQGDAVSSPVHLTLRPPASAVLPAGALGARSYGPLPAAPRNEDGTPLPTVPAAAPHAAVSIACSREGLARARSFTRDTLGNWSLAHCGDDATLVMTELAANAVTHAASRCPGVPDVRLGFRLEPAHLLLTVSDPDDHPPVVSPGAGSGLEEHGRGLRIVDALSEAWGWTPTVPAGKTVWARLSTRPPI
ncbi:ATP-binding protein [Streptomyces sp. Vc74B-19]|uniref:ATP-binding protein n=1 Tax=unclassified Streptomyces TaxID=2593676 RepID=UPI001BFC2839|nr:MULTISPECIES: ATP-binding protein [unclassified Streptomyces]MBT3167110.1 ATP-binding protein [Streptomyces sp. Vc74B-19]MDU0302863.1 ATP-binding protein [Streptomyces sp. PAL114]